jgi:hypothetical protein
MRRVLVVILGSLVLLVGLAGCGASDGSGSGGTPSATLRPGY